MVGRICLLLNEDALYLICVRFVSQKGYYRYCSGTIPNLTWSVAFSRYKTGHWIAV